MKVYCTEASKVAIIFVIFFTAYTTNAIIGIVIYQEYERTSKWLQVAVWALVGFTAFTFTYYGTVLDYKT